MVRLLVTIDLVTPHDKEDRRKPEEPRSTTSSSISMNKNLCAEELAAALDQVPAGVTIVDNDGRILYYNEYCTRFVDRKPEYIGRDIASCHCQSSVERINAMFAELTVGSKQEIYYETQRGERKLGVTVARFRFQGEDVGFIQCISEIK
jgi:DUF438 domain-containing protein